MPGRAIHFDVPDGELRSEFNRYAKKLEMQGPLVRICQLGNWFIMGNIFHRKPEPLRDFWSDEHSTSGETHGENVKAMFRGGGIWTPHANRDGSTT